MRSRSSCSRVCSPTNASTPQPPSTQTATSRSSSHPRISTTSRRPIATMVRLPRTLSGPLPHILHVLRDPQPPEPHGLLGGATVHQPEPLGFRGDGVRVVHHGEVLRVLRSHPLGEGRPHPSAEPLEVRARGGLDDLTVTNGEHERAAG